MKAIVFLALGVAMITASCRTTQNQNSEVAGLPKEDSWIKEVYQKICDPKIAKLSPETAEQFIGTWSCTWRSAFKGKFDTVESMLKVERGISDAEFIKMQLDQLYLFEKNNTWSRFNVEQDVENEFEIIEQRRLIKWLGAFSDGEFIYLPRVVARKQLKKAEIDIDHANRITAPFCYASKLHPEYRLEALVRCKPAPSES